MSIPKVIHYCWFGRGEKSELMEKCIASWKEYCPDWEIIEWNEDNFDPCFCNYAEKAYKKKRYAFTSDVARLKIIYENGGVYFDTDAELIANIDDFLNYNAWFAYATESEIGTGIGFGAEKGNNFVKTLLDNYLDFPKTKKFDLCTRIDTKVFHLHYPNFAADHNVSQYENGILIVNNFWKYSIQHYTNTWMTPMQKAYTTLRNHFKFIAVFRNRIRDCNK